MSARRCVRHPVRPAKSYLAQVVVLEQAIEDLDDVLGPVLRPPR